MAMADRVREFIQRRQAGERPILDAWRQQPQQTPVPPRPISSASGTGGAAVPQPAAAPAVSRETGPAMGPEARMPRDQVMAIQQRLHAAGFDPGPIDGLWGPRTQRALDMAASAQSSAAPPMSAPMARPGSMAQVPGMRADDEDMAAGGALTPAQSAQYASQAPMDIPMPPQDYGHRDPRRQGWLPPDNMMPIGMGNEIAPGMPMTQAPGYTGAPRLPGAPGGVPMPMGIDLGMTEPTQAPGPMMPMEPLAVGTQPMTYAPGAPGGVPALGDMQGPPDPFAGMTLQQLEAIDPQRLGPDLMRYYAPALNAAIQRERGQGQMNPATPQPMMQDLWQAYPNYQRGGGRSLTDLELLGM